MRRFATGGGLARRPDVGLLLSTTSARESHEWAGFQAGIFSHEVRSGLYGAADLDGDGRISYPRSRAFVDRANAGIPNERFRPDVFAHAPRGGSAADRSTCARPRASPARRRLGARGQPLLFEDTLGVRLADFHNARGRALSLLVPDARAACTAPHQRRSEFAIPSTGPRS